MKTRFFSEPPVHRRYYAYNFFKHVPQVMVCQSEEEVLKTHH